MATNGTNANQRLACFLEYPSHTDREILADKPDITISNARLQKWQSHPTEIKLLRYSKNSLSVKTWKLKSPKCGKQENARHHLSLVLLGSLRRD